MESKKTVGFVVISHSNKLAQEIIEFVKIFNTENFSLENGGDVEKEAYGTNTANVKEAIKKADNGAGVLVFVDMGSSIFHAQKAIEELQGQVEVQIADTPLIEGLISAVAANGVDMKLKDLKIIAEESRNFMKIKKK